MRRRLENEVIAGHLIPDLDEDLVCPREPVEADRDTAITAMGKLATNAELTGNRAR
jgi:hypothetical protein